MKCTVKAVKIRIISYYGKDKYSLLCECRTYDKELSFYLNNKNNLNKQSGSQGVFKS